MSQPRDTMLAANAFDDDQWLGKPPADDPSFADEALDEPPPNTPEEDAAYAAMDRVWGVLALAIAVIVGIVMIVKWLSQ